MKRSSYGFNGPRTPLTKEIASEIQSRVAKGFGGQIKSGSLPAKLQSIADRKANAPQGESGLNRD
jgi:hypothetical protein